MNTKQIPIVSLMIRAFLPVAAVVATVFMQRPAHSADILWTNGAGGEFTAASNWSNGVGPNSNDFAHFQLAFFPPGPTYPVSFANNATTRGMYVHYDNVTWNLGGRTYTQSGSTAFDPFGVGQVAGENGSLTINNGIVNTSAAAAGLNTFIGKAGIGTVTLNAGATWNVSTPLILGQESAAQGTLNLSGSAMLVSNNDLIVGDRGVGVVTQTGGSNTITGVGRALRIGHNGSYSVATGTYILSAGSLSADYIVMGQGEATQPARGYFNQTGGDVTVLTHVLLGGAVPSVGDYRQSGGTLDVGAALHVGFEQRTGAFTLSGSGELSAQQLILGVSQFTGGRGFFNQNSGSVFVENLAINRGTLNLSGGLLAFNTYSRNTTGDEDGVFNFVAGTIQLAGNRGIGTDPAILELFGTAPTIAAGKGLIVEGTATLQTAVTLDGGTFSAGQLVDASALHLHRGTFNLTNQAVTIGSGGLLGSTLDVNDDMTVNVTLGTTNQGLVTGDGQIGGTFTNAASGVLRGDPGKLLRLTGANNVNAGRINLLGGGLEFTQNLTNNVAALISGNGSLIVGSGLVNQGTMNFAGTANIVGDVTNAPGGKIISGGGGATIFYDDIVNNGEVRTSTNGFTVFFGSVSGSGSFTGTGTVNFEGDLSPGNSPGSVNFAGGVVFGPESKLLMELGGTAANQYDRVNVSGVATLAGTLDVDLINGFVPVPGNSFTALTFASPVGTFDSIVDSSLGGGLVLSPIYSATSLVLYVGLPGDANLDGTVNGLDYPISPAHYNQCGLLFTEGDYNGDGCATAADYTIWADHFGQNVSPPGSGAIPASVPEPASWVPAVAVGLVLAGMGSRRISRRPVR